MPHTSATTYRRLLETATQDSLTHLRQVPPEHCFRQLAPGKATPLWIAGHLANTLDRVLIGWVLGETPRLTEAESQPFAPAYAGGLPISTRPADYPSYEDLLDRYTRLAAYALPKVEAFSDADLDGLPRGGVPESRKAIFSSVAISLQRIALHDAYHRGQLSMILHHPA